MTNTPKNTPTPNKTTINTWRRNFLTSAGVLAVAGASSGFWNLVSTALNDPKKLPSLKENPTDFETLMQDEHIKSEFINELGLDKSASHEEIYQSLQKLPQGAFEDFSHHLEEKLGEHPAKQIVLNFLATAHFFKFIIPHFLSGDAYKALGNALPFISFWYGASNSHTREEFNHEMLSALKGTTYMALIVMAIQATPLDLEAMVEEKVERKFAADIAKFEKNKDIQGVLTDLGIVIDDDIGAETLYISGKDSDESKNEIHISKDIFLEILPYILNPQKHNEIYSILETYIWPPNQKRRVREHMKLSFEKRRKKDTQEQEAALLKKFPESQEKLADIISFEVLELITFFTISQGLFGLGLTTSANDKIHQVGDKIKVLALANGKSATDAEKLQKKFINTIIEYLPNRFAFFSDLGPFMASAQKNGAKGIVNMVDSMIPIVIPNLQQATVKFANIISTASNKPLKKKNYLERADNFWGRVARHLAFHIETLFLKVPTGITNGSGADNVSTTFFRDKTKVQDIPKSEMQVGFNIRKSLQNINLPAENEEMLQEAGVLLSQVENITDTLPDDASFSNVVELMIFLYKMSEKEEGQGKNTALEILQKYNKKVQKIAKSLLPQLQTGEYQPFKKFLQQNILGQRVKVSPQQMYERWAQEIISRTKENRLISQSEMIEIFGDKAYDLEFCTEKNTIKYGGIKGIYTILERNLTLLKTLEERWYTHWEQLQKIFLENIIASGKASKEKSGINTWEVVIRKALSDEKFSGEFQAFFTNILQKNEETQSFVEDIKAQKSVSPEEKEQLKTIKKNFLETIGISQKYYKTIEKFVHSSEQYVSADVYEIIQMILLIQSPYVVAISKTVEEAIKATEKLWTLPDIVKEGIIGAGTYAISMFADNYVWEIVGINLSQKLLGYDAGKSIEAMAKFAIYGGSKVVTGNSPNILLKKAVWWDFYFESTSRTDKEVENKVLKVNRILQDLKEKDILSSEQIGLIYSTLENASGKNPIFGAVSEMLVDVLSLLAYRGTASEMVTGKLSVWEYFTSAVGASLQAIWPGKVADDPKEILMGPIWRFREKIKNTL